jgi:hypothetical protein
MLITLLTLHVQLKQDLSQQDLLPNIIKIRGTAIFSASPQCPAPPLKAPVVLPIRLETISTDIDIDIDINIDIEALRFVDIIQTSPVVLR